MFTLPREILLTILREPKGDLHKDAPGSPANDAWLDLCRATAAYIDAATADPRIGEDLAVASMASMVLSMSPSMV
jgi:hypothetical protein